MALKLLLKGMVILVIAEVLDSKPDTVLSWLRRTAEHSAQVEARWLSEFKVSKVKLDELWTFLEKNSCAFGKRNGGVLVELYSRTPVDVGFARWSSYEIAIKE